MGGVEPRRKRRASTRVPIRLDEALVTIALQRVTYEQVPAPVLNAVTDGLVKGDLERAITPLIREIERNQLTPAQISAMESYVAAWVPCWNAAGSSSGSGGETNAPT
jgi:hypothetical protein